MHSPVLLAITAHQIISASLISVTRGSHRAVRKSSWADATGPRAVGSGGRGKSSAPNPIACSVGRRRCCPRPPDCLVAGPCRAWSCSAPEGGRRWAHGRRAAGSIYKCEPNEMGVRQEDMVGAGCHATTPQRHHNGTDDAPFDIFLVPPAFLMLRKMSL